MLSILKLIYLYFVNYVYFSNKQKIRKDLVNHVWKEATFKARLYNDYDEKLLKEWHEDQSRFVKENTILTLMETKYLFDQIIKIREAVDKKIKVAKYSYESPIPHCIVEWIEFCELENVKFLAKGGNVALKVFNGDSLPDEEFFQEAYWNHIFTKQWNYRPCVVGILGFTKNQEGKYMIVLDLCEGGDLQNYLQKYYKIMSWKDRVKVAWDISYDIYRAVLREIANTFRDATAGTAAAPRAPFYETNITESSTSEEAILGAQKIEAREYYNNKNKEYKLEVEEEEAFVISSKDISIFSPRLEAPILPSININSLQPILQALVAPLQNLDEREASL
ncbi:29305_t:CDS:2 [Racocetra persica]|uniref:29305_t:CDS:1 n=1 Tax=Racocetra persica TaxID=160502 RepID=A0ACA9KPN4_9GLOM|nr:29305_t:CDS:2 [Racocetra persica]